jgi:hypothetical protein
LPKRLPYLAASYHPPQPNVKDSILRASLRRRRPPRREAEHEGLSPAELNRGLPGGTLCYGVSFGRPPEMGLILSGAATGHKHPGQKGPGRVLAGSWIAVLQPGPAGCQPWAAHSPDAFLFNGQHRPLPSPSSEPEVWRDGPVRSAAVVVHWRGLGGGNCPGPFLTDCWRCPGAGPPGKGYDGLCFRRAVGESVQGRSSREIPSWHPKRRRTRAKRRRPEHER